MGDFSTELGPQTSFHATPLDEEEQRWQLWKGSPEKVESQTDGEEKPYAGT